MILLQSFYFYVLCSFVSDEEKKMRKNFFYQNENTLEKICYLYLRLEILAKLREYIIQHASPRLLIFYFINSRSFVALRGWRNTP